MKNFILQFDVKRPSHFMCCDGNLKPIHGPESAKNVTVTTLVPSSVGEIVIFGEGAFSTTKTNANIYAKDVQRRGEWTETDTANYVISTNARSVHGITGVILEGCRILLSLIPNVTSAKGMFVLPAAKGPGHFRVPFNVRAATS